MGTEETQCLRTQRGLNLVTLMLSRKSELLIRSVTTRSWRIFHSTFSGLVLTLCIMQIQCITSYQVHGVSFVELVLSKEACTRVESTVVINYRRSLFFSSFAYVTPMNANVKHRWYIQETWVDQSPELSMPVGKC